MGEMMKKTIRTTILVILATYVVPVTAYGQQYAAEPAKFLEATLAASEGEYRRALQLLEEVLEKESENVVVLYERATILAESGRAERAENELRALVARHPDFYDAQKFLARILLDRSGNDPSKIGDALVHLQRAFRLRSDDIGSGVTVAQILVSQNRHEEAAKVLADMLEISPDNRTINFLYAQVLTKLGRGNESATYYERVLRADPVYVPAITQLVDIYEKSNEFRKAAQVLEPLIELDPLNIELQRQQGMYYLRGGDSERARRRFEAAVQADPKEPRSRYFLAEALSDLGELKKGEELYRSLLSETPNEPELLISLGMNLAAQRRFEEAEKLFTTLSTDPRLTDAARRSASTHLATIEHQRGNYDGALAKAVAIVNDSKGPTYQALNVALDIFRRRSDWKAGLALLEPLATKFPTDDYIQTRLTEFLLRSGDPRGAESANALRKSGRRQSLTVSELYAQMARYDESAKVLLDLLAENPDDADIRFQLGSVYERADRFEDAEREFLAVLDRDELHAPTLNYLGYMWADQGRNLQRAAELLDQAVKIEPRNGAYIDSLGWVHFRLGNYELAERHLLDAASLVPRDPTIQEHLGDLFARLGDREKALERYRTALGLEPAAEDEKKLKSKIADLERKEVSKR